MSSEWDSISQPRHEISYAAAEDNLVQSRFNTPTGNYKSLHDPEKSLCTFLNTKKNLPEKTKKDPTIFAIIFRFIG